jgi:predicted TIM-barrel fold metal-dependent hydrolase
LVLSKLARARIEARLEFLQRLRNDVIIDADAHPSDPALYPDFVIDRLASEPNYYQGRPITGPELLSEMDRADVDLALCWQNPAVLRYGDDPADNFARLHAANEAISDLAERHPDRIIPGGWTDPKALGLDAAIELVRICVEEWGFPIVKLNPAQNAYRIDSDLVMAVVDAIVDYGAVPAFHFGSDTEFTPVDGLERVAARHPDRPVVAVHMGGGGGHFVTADPIYLAARELGLRTPNLFYVLSAKRDTHMESDLIAYAAAGEPFRSNIAVASDVPYGRITWNFGGFRAMFADLARGAAHHDGRLRADPGLFDEEMIQGFMGRNFADLVISIDRRLLAQAAEEAAR